MRRGKIIDIYHVRMLTAKLMYKLGSGLILKPMKINTVLVCSNIQLSGLRGGRGRGEGKGARGRKDMKVA